MEKKLNPTYSIIFFALLGTCKLRELSKDWKKMSWKETDEQKIHKKAWLP